MKSILHTILLLFTATALISCEPGPRDIELGSEECAHCKMMITEAEFASQLLTNRGKAYFFDSIECMVMYEQKEDDGNVHSRWVSDLSTEEWIAAEEAHYLQSEKLKSPMGMYLSAHADESSAEEFQAEYLGELLDWNELVELVSTE